MEKRCVFTCLSTQVFALQGAGVVNYLEGAVYKSFIQVNHDTVLAVVRYADLWQEELGWWLQRQYTLHFTI